MSFGKLWRRARAVALFLCCAAAACRGTGPLPAGGGPDAAVEVAPPLAGTARTPIPGGRSCQGWMDCSWWQEPDEWSVCCEGECTNTAVDPRNCGGCGVACASGELCEQGVCRPSSAVCLGVVCEPGWICCGGSCVKASLHYNNCGGCAIECRFGGARCAVGNCCPAAVPDAACDDLPTCPDGEVLCAEGCRDIVSNPLNCGGCGRVCPSERPRCLVGNCRP
jgi:hypothetical protein